MTEFARPAVLAALLLAAGCATLPAPTPRAPTRYAWVTGIRPDRIAYYKQLHAHPWPAVARRISASHIRNFSIHMKEIGGRHYLFAYLEYTGDNFEADMKAMADDPETRRWWKETDPCQIPLPDAAAGGKVWSDTEEVFFQP